MKTRLALMVLIGLTFATTADSETTDHAALERIQTSLSAEVPRVLCLDVNFATGGQPRSKAYAQAAAAGFRSVLSLRAANEGIDLARERTQVEAHKMRYFNIPVLSAAPRPAQADEFLRIARDKSNHPMLINCATANRVGAFMMILRVVDHGWSMERALEEAVKIGLRGDELKTFATNYIAAYPAKRS